MTGSGLIVVVAVLLASTVFGLWRKRTDGVVRQDAAATAGKATGETAAPKLTAEQLGGDLGARATLVQFSSAFCQPCRATKHILADVAAKVEGVRHLEIDAESRLELVREMGIMRTPTTLVLDGEGRITARAAGVPRREQVLAAIAQA